MSFTLRIDLESNKGIVLGLPKLLDLLNKYGFKASFYLTMGGESNVFEILKHRGKIPSAGTRSIKIFSFFEKIRMLFFPRDFVGKNLKIIKRILDEGHELGIHGWKHRRWTRALDEIDVGSELDLAFSRYELIFGTKAISFCSPAFRTNSKSIKLLGNKKIKVVSDFDSFNPVQLKKCNFKNVPVTIKGKNNSPIIEYLVGEGKTDSEILNYIKKNIKKNTFSSMYGHGLYECIHKIDLIENLFIYLRDKEIKVKTILEVANENTPNN